MALAMRQATAATPRPADASREFQFAPDDFRFLAAIAYREAGIALSEAKSNLLYGRLSRRLRSLGLSEVASYRTLLEDHASGEIEHFINAIATNHTKFFRERHHIDHFRDEVLAPFLQTHPNGGRMRIWSAGCSSGEEPYSLAAVIAHALGDQTKYDIRILATDIDTDILARALRGDYEASALDEVPAPYRSLLSSHDAASASGFSVSPRLKNLVTFKHLNLMGEWPMRGPFDAIFCRNVMIYFDAPTKARLIDQFTNLIGVNAWLYIGHSESLIGSHPRLHLQGRTIYRRIK